MHENAQVLNYQIFWIIKHYLHWPKFLEVIICYGPHTWALQHIRGVIQLDISFICLFRVIIWPFSYRFLHSEAVNGAGEETKMLTYTHSWRPLWTCPWDMPVSMTKHFSGKKEKLLNLGLLPSIARLSGFAYYWMLDYKLYYLQIFN